jgi:hypothetical protein
MARTMLRDVRALQIKWAEDYGLNPVLSTEPFNPLFLEQLETIAKNHSGTAVYSHYHHDHRTQAREGEAILPQARPFLALSSKTRSDCASFPGLLRFNSSSSSAATGSSSLAPPFCLF